MALFSLIIVKSLVSSMRVEHKFKSQCGDPAAGNDFHARIFGENAARRWKEFKYYVSLFDLIDSPLSKKTLPNCKVQEFLDHINNMIHGS